MQEPVDRNSRPAAFNGTDTGVPQETVPALLRRHAREAPDAIAVVDGAGSLTYGELDAWADRLTRRLISRGVGPETLVGVVLDRSAELLVTMLAVLRAGAAYLPIDPGYPPQRLGFMLADADPVLVITTEKSAVGLPAGCPLLTLADVEATPRRPGTEQPAPEVRPENLAYVVYTSGSTGMPKGIGTTHRDVVGLATDHRYGDGTHACVLFHAPVAFDASVYEFWVPLLTGGRVVVAPPDDLTPDLLAKLVADHGLTALFLTPALFNLFVIEDPRSMAGLRHVWVGGERILPRSVQRAAEACPDTVFVNGYGPTETTVFSTAHLVDRAVPIGDDVPIGRPMDNMTGYVLDERLQPLGAHEPGELYLAGVGVARGYLRRPGQTADRFVACPYGAPGERMYRTGDIVSWSSHGELLYHGRCDHQVKVRGFRIEPGEVETVLLAHPALAHAAVIAREDRGSAEGKQLVGYAVARTGPGAAAAPGSEELRAFLAQRLPEFMVPTVFVMLDRMPLTANGKLDRAALPAPAFHGRHYRAPRTAAEQQLAAVFADVLGVDQIGADDDFFALGGDSIQSIQVVTRARAAGWQVSSGEIFQARTVARLAETASAVDQENRRPALAELPGGGVGWMPLMPVARWIIELGPGYERLLQAVVLELPTGITRTELVTVITAVVHRHDLLRARLVSDGLVVDPPRDLDVDRLVRRVACDGTWDGDTWRQLLVDEVDAAARRLDPVAGALTQFVWFDPGEGSGRLLLALHHLAVDSVTWRILMPDFAIAWAGAHAGLAPVLPPVPTSARRWAHALVEEAATAPRAAELSRWLAVVDGPDPVLGSRRRDPAIDVMATVEKIRVLVPVPVTEVVLAALPARFHGGVNDGLLTALALAVTQWRRRRGVAEPTTLLRLEGHGREEGIVPGADLSRTAGWFTSVFPVRLDLTGIDLDEAFTGGPAAGAAVKAVKEQLLSVPDRGIGYGLLRYLNDQTAAVLRPHALGQIGFNYLGRFSAADMPRQLRGTGWTLTGDLAELAELAELDAGHNPDMPAQSEVDINATVTDTGGGLRLGATFSAPTGVLTPDEVQELAELWGAALEALARHASLPEAGGRTPSDLPLVAVRQDEIEAWEKRYPALSDVWPLTPLQSGMLHHTMLSDADVETYHVQLVFSLIGPVAPARLRAAAQALLDRHAALRAAFVPSAGGDLVQLVVDGITVPWREVELPGAEQLDDVLAAERREPFDPAAPPLVRMTLVRVGDIRTELVLTAHHALFDGWSEPILLRDLLTLYARGPLPAPSDFGDFLGWVARRDRQESLRRHSRALEGLPGPSLLVPRGASAGGTGFGAVMVPLDGTAAGALARRAGALGTTLNSLVQAAWAVVLGQLTGSTDVVFGATVSGRPPALGGMDSTVGLFINTLPVRARCSPWHTLADVVTGLQAAQAALLEHHHTSLLEIHQASGFDVLFDTIVAFQSFPAESAAAVALAETATGTTLTGFRATGGSHYPLVVVAEQDLGLRLSLQYRRNVLEDDAAGRFAAQLGHVLQLMITEPGTTVGTIDLRTPDDRAEAPRPAAVGAISLPAAIERWLAADPLASALIDGERQMSLQDLHARAGRLTRASRRAGLGPGAVAAVACADPFDRVAALLAVLTVGAGCVPIDPDDPRPWCEAVLADAGAGAVFADSGDVRLSWCGLPRVVAVPGDPAIGGPLRAAHPANVAYLYYTPDEAARPCGLVVTHTGLSLRAATFTAPAGEPLTCDPGTPSAELLVAICAGYTVQLGTAAGGPGHRPPGRALTPSLLPAPSGAAGEAWTTARFAEGFLGRAALTAQRFVADPAGPPGSRMHHCGDPWESSAIEAVLTATPSVAEAAVVVTDGTITAYVVRHEGASAEDLRDVVAQRLPARLIPTGVVELTALATTSDGRIDRRRLPDAARCRRRAARDARDALLCRLFAEVLEQPDIGIDDGFFALGGNSLLATRLIGRLRSETGMQISIRSVFQYPTVAELTERWDEIASVSRPGLSRMKRS